jgi:hypothetical protein
MLPYPELIPVEEINDIDIALPMMFAYQQLLTSQVLLKDGRKSSDVWKQIHRHRLYEDLRAGGAKEYPHGVVIAQPHDIMQRAGIPNRDAVLKCVLVVASVREYPGGGARMAHFRDSYKAARTALLSLPDAGVRVYDGSGDLAGTGNLMGYVSGVREIGVHYTEQTYGDRQVVQHGPRCELSYQFE